MPNIKLFLNNHVQLIVPSFLYFVLPELLFEVSQPIGSTCKDIWLAGSDYRNIPTIPFPTDSVRAWLTPPHSDSKEWQCHLELT